MHLPDLSLPFTDPVLIFALVMLLILVLPLLFERFRVPGIVGLIIAGVIIGPHALGLLARDQTIELLGTVGILYIMFTAGLEVDLNEFSRQRNRSIAFGLLTFALPQGLGTLLGYYLLGFPWMVSILLGSVFASHTLLAYPIVSRLGLSKEESATTSVGATILTDTAALLVLAIVVRADAGDIGPTFWLQMIGLLSFYVTAVLWGVPRLGRWFFQKVSSDGVAEFVFVLAVVFSCAFLAAMAGVEPIIGAFLAGLALNRLVPEHSTLMNRIQFVGNSLFIPFFLLSVGMLVDVGVLAGETGAWVVAGGMLATVLVTKWLAAMLTRPLLRFSADQAWMMFGLTVPQAAATLAAVLIGYDVGLFGDSVLNGTILMMLVTCMVGPWIAERYGRRVALQAAFTPYEPSVAPQRILVPLANPESASSLMDLALLLRSPTSEEPLFPLTVARDGKDVAAGVAAGEKLLGHAVFHAAAANIAVVPITRVDHNVASGIVRAVKEQRISTIIIGWGGGGSASAFVFGSVLDQLLQECREMMLVSKVEQPLATLGRVVLTIPPFADREAGFSRALRAIKLLTSQMGARILLVASEDSIQHIREWLDQTRPDVTVDEHPIASWAGLVPALDTLLDENDLLLSLNVREGTLAWRPALNRLPRLLTQRFPRTSLIVLYPPEAADALHLDSSSPEGSSLAALLDPDFITLGLAGESTREVLSRMLEGRLRDDPALLRQALPALTDMEPDYVPELLPGVVFYHARLREPREPMLFISISREGLNLPMTAGLVHVVLVLLSPEQERPERHLRRLAEVTRLVRSGEAVERLRSASTADEVRTLLTESLRAPAHSPGETGP